ncbi:MAG: hypothetical protein Ta2B_19440 [Termitinemataceae bacterium]|nr:MAG: hypothetical protein Ta2B_19440 [Termitinemataceae bacterium]
MGTSKSSGTQERGEILSQRDSAAKSAQPFAGKCQSKGFCPAFEPEKMRQKIMQDCNE